MTKSHKTAERVKIFKNQFLIIDMWGPTKRILNSMNLSENKFVKNVFPLEYLTPDDLIEWFEVDERGQLIWKKSKRRAAKGDLAGTRIGNVRKVCIFYNKLNASDVAFTIHHGRFPLGPILFLNGDDSDFSKENLWEARKQ